MSEPSVAASVARPPGAWPLAAWQLERWRARNDRADALLENLPTALSGVDRARVQSLLYGAIRHRGRIESHLRPLLNHPPRTIVWAMLMLAGYELIEADGEEGKSARIGHHAVEQAKRLASPKEAGLVNAVIRRLARALERERPPEARAPVDEWARYYSHPEWLVERWRAQFGPVSARALLEWNLQPAVVFARWRQAEPPGSELSWLRSVPGCAGFFRIEPGCWEAVQPLVRDGILHIQDPATRLPVELLAPAPGETVLDLCAAPGGKSLALADAMKQGLLISIDVPGPRMVRLEQNLARACQAVKTVMIAGDLLRQGRRLLSQQALPVQANAVLIDVPCSNTGVMRHRVDVKWRLQEEDIRRHAQQQLALLEAASGLVAPGGRLVYSTCSLEPEENEQVVDAFVRRSRGGFARIDHRVSRPWETGHDGAGAFLLRRSS